ncbi:hypothetical protein DPMN_031158 [Dreissena polymorpha]|uniref:Receptor ligand binding region domain-containing protein n=1 Tax=Dreissena polymorpha TaxID=45954 RepID=A0A9D4RGU8_DREPO|nr:hypothetical protein DPMN_031158 [Dreissena polymorpha]
MITAGAFAGDFGRQKDRVFRLLTRVGSNFNTLFDFFVNVLSMHKWRKMNIIYDPYGQTDNSEKFCHIVADGFHHEFRNNDAYV